MKRQKSKKGVLTIEASISYSIFLMVIVTLLFFMRIIFAYGLIQHAAAQTAKELSMYTYLYQASGLNAMNQEIQNMTKDRETQFNTGVDSLVNLYGSIQDGDIEGIKNWEYDDGTSEELSFENVLKTLGAVAVGEAGEAANRALFTTVVRPMMASYIDAEGNGRNASSRLKALGIKDGIKGLNLSSSKFFEDGITIDLVVCYTIDPIFPIDIISEMNFMNRAFVRGMNGEAIFDMDPSEQPVKGPVEEPSSEAETDDTEEEVPSVWDELPVQRGKIIQKQTGLRNMPDNFESIVNFDRKTGKATAACSIDITQKSYSNSTAGIRAIKEKILNEANGLIKFEKDKVDDVEVTADEIQSREVIVFIPSNTKNRQVDQTALKAAIAQIERDSRYKGVKITVQEID